MDNQNVADQKEFAPGLERLEVEQEWMEACDTDYGNVITSLRLGGWDVYAADAAVRALDTVGSVEVAGALEGAVRVVGMNGPHGDAVLNLAKAVLEGAADAGEADALREGLDHDRPATHVLMLATAVMTEYRRTRTLLVSSTFESVIDAARTLAADVEQRRAHRPYLGTGRDCARRFCAALAERLDVPAKAAE